MPENNDGAHVSGIGGAGAGNLDVSAAGTFKSFSLLTWIFGASALIFWLTPLVNICLINCRLCSRLREVKSISQGVEGTLPYPPLRTPDTVAGTSSQLPVALSPTSPCLGTPNIAAGTSPQFPAVLPPTSPCLGTPDIAAGTSPQFPAVLPPTSPCLGTPDIAASTSSRLPAVPPRGEIIGDIHKDGDASTSVGHLSEKIMPWQDWENSFMAFKAFFDGGVTHSMKSSHDVVPAPQDCVLLWNGSVSRALCYFCLSVMLVDGLGPHSSDFAWHGYC
ncbi:unnamed protein product [Prunus armeniaca]